MRHAIRRPFGSALLPLILLASACLPYTVGSTAQPLLPGEVRRSTSLYVIPNAVEMFGDSVAGTFRGIDFESRWGLTDGVDIGLRVPALSGAVVTAKYRVLGGSDPEDAAFSLMPGLGLVNLGEHLHFEMSALASGPTWSYVTLYGGLRVMQVAPMSRSAVHDSPTAGGFVGIRIGNEEVALIPELGVFRDRSALGLRDSHVILVPAITVQGPLLDGFFRFGRRR